MQETNDALVISLARHDGQEVHIPWATISRITAFKQDLFNPEIVVMEICCDHGSYEVSDQDGGGFAMLSALLERRLNSFPGYHRWWPRVTDPLGRQEDVALYPHFDE